MYLLLLQVHKANLRCDTWIREVDIVLRRFKWLVFFTIPKLLILHSAVADRMTSRRKIMLEFYHIFKRDIQTWREVERATEVCVPSKADISVLCKTKPCLRGPFFSPLIYKKRDFGEILSLILQ